MHGPDTSMVAAEDDTRKSKRRKRQKPDDGAEVKCGSGAGSAGNGACVANKPQWPVLGFDR